MGVLEKPVIKIKMGKEPVIKISRVAIRYSASFFDAAVSMQLLNQIENDFKQLADLLSESTDLSHVLSNPTIDRHSLENILKEISEKLKLQKLTLNLLCLLAQRRRTNLLSEIIQHFTILSRTERNQLMVDVTAKSPLNKNQIVDMEKALSSRTGKEILLNVNIDQSILGGIIVNYGSYKLDFSLKSKLNELKHELERLG